MSTPAEAISANGKNTSKKKNSLFCQLGRNVEREEETKKIPEFIKIIFKSWFSFSELFFVYISL